MKIKICRIPPLEPCRGLKEETDLPPPAPGKEEIGSVARDVFEPVLVESIEASSATTLSVGTPPDAGSNKEERKRIK